MGKCNINLAVTFDSTADTDRLRAIEIAGLVRTFLAVQMDAANVKVEVHGAALNYAEAYEQDRDEAGANPFGNPATDGLN